MSLYGYQRPTTPALDRLAAESFVFNRGFCNGTASTIGIRHTFTGRYSTRFMLERRVAKFWTDDLGALGYRHFVLGVGGSDYDGISLEAFSRNQASELKGRMQFTPVAVYPEGDKAKRTLDILKKLPVQEGIFCYLQYFAPHVPWNHRKGGHSFGESQQDRYDENLRFVDDCISDLLEGLKKLGLYRNAIIIIAADHGTQIGEHGKNGGWSLYQEQLHIPFLIRIPGMRPGRSDVPVSSIDIGPTILSCFGSVSPTKFHGVSLLDVIQGRKAGVPREDVYALSAFTDAFALLEGGRWKTIYNREDNYWELYDLKTDPGEKSNLSGQKELLEPRMKKMFSFLWKGRHTYNGPFHYAGYQVERKKASE